VGFRNPSAADRARQHYEDAPPIPASEATVSDLDLTHGVATELAGIFYLVNVVMAPEVEQCLGASLLIDGTIGPFGLIAELACALLPADERRPHDPVWALLALLDGDQPDPPVRSGLDRRLALALPPVRLRLAEALGLDPGDPAALARELLVCDGTVHVAGPHVDIVMALTEARLSVRLAGLDRDPGWCPAFGRVISFHFR
jgi:hypothetical protein